MKSYEVRCNQENIIIGNLVNAEDSPLLVDAIAFIRNWRPVKDAFKFVHRPKLGELLKCPRCNGMLSIQGSYSLEGESNEEVGAQPDGLLIGQFTIG